MNIHHQWFGYRRQKSAKGNGLLPHDMRWDRKDWCFRKYWTVFHNDWGKYNESALMSAYKIKKSVRLYVKRNKSHSKTQAKLLTIFTLHKQYSGLFQGVFEILAQFRQIKTWSCVFKKTNKKQYMNLRSHPKLISPIGTHNSRSWNFRDFNSSTFLTEWQEKGQLFKV